MAFSRTPTVDTYSSVQVPVVWDLALNPINVTTSFQFVSGLTNMVPYKQKENESVQFAETRYGFVGSEVAAGSGLISRGCYVWEKDGVLYYYVVVSDGSTGNTIYTSTDGSTWASVQTFTQDSRNPCRFTEYIDATNVKKLILVTGTKGYIFTDNTAPTEITDVDFPSPHVPFPIALDGYLFLAKADTGDIYNSNLNAPQTWTAGDFISSELYPDDIQALVRIDNYILAIGTQGSEYFYDAANATASPLARVQGSSLPIGTRHPHTIASGLDKLTFLATSNDGGLSMVNVQDMRYSVMEADVPLHIINNQVRNGTITSAGMRGLYVRMEGELFYILNTRGNNNTTTPEYYTFMFSYSTKKWVRLTHRTTHRYPIFFATPGNSVGMLTNVCGHTAAGVFFGTMNAGYPADTVFGTAYPIVQSALIPPQQFGTLNTKVMGRLGVNYTTYTESLGITVTWSDDNMVTFSTARSLASTMQGNFPFMTQLGSFRNRGFKIDLTGNNGRLFNLECDINKGMR